MVVKLFYIKDKITEHTNKLPANWIKDEKFKNEQEYRFVFIPHYTNRDTILSPVKINIQNIERFCERIR